MRSTNYVPNQDAPVIYIPQFQRVSRKFGIPVIPVFSNWPKRQSKLLINKYNTWNFLDLGVFFNVEFREQRPVVNGPWVVVAACRRQGKYPELGQSRTRKWNGHNSYIAVQK